MNTQSSIPVPDDTPDPGHQLQRELYLQIADDLRSMLPPPPQSGPGGEADAARRLKLAIAMVAAMLPANAEEAGLAARAVAAGAHASDCLRRVGLYPDMFEEACKMRAQAASMGREARGYRSQLLRVQAQRQKREADDATREAAAWTEYCVAGLMTEGVEGGAAGDAAAETVEAAEARLRGEADRYAGKYPQRVRLIRRLGRLPNGCEIDPPGPALLQAIIQGDSERLRAADAWRPAAA